MSRAPAPSARRSRRRDASDDRFLAQPLRAVRAAGALPLRRGGARPRLSRAAGRSASRTASPPRGEAEQRLALQSSARVNEAYRALQDPVGARAVPAVAARRRRVRRNRHRAAARLPRAPARAARSGRRSAGGARRARARGAARTRSRAERAELEQRARARCSTPTRDGTPARVARARAQLPRQARRPTIDDDARGRSRPASSTDGAAADLRARRVARAARAPARGRHRPRHDQFARRDGAQRHSGRAARRATAVRCCRRSSATARPASTSATRAQAQQARDPQNTIVSVKRLMGRGLADLADARRFPYRFVDAPGMVQARARAPA